ncbi:hypothetical protein C8R46DRAFT_1233026 [Mycena filopes]|nr:hypothetical protein C8R46DRAFT_1233026 [Mycena filopes]
MSRRRRGLDPPLTIVEDPSICIPDNPPGLNAAGSASTSPLLLDDGIPLNHPGFGTNCNPIQVDENGRVVRNLNSTSRRSHSTKKDRAASGRQREPPATPRRGRTRARAARDEASDRPYAQLASVSHRSEAPSLTSSSSTASSSSSATSLVASSSTASSSTSASGAAASEVDSGLSNFYGGRVSFRTAGRVPFSAAPQRRPRVVVPLRIVKRDLSKRNGYRTPRDDELLPGELYLTDARPPTDDKNPDNWPVDPEYKCSICLSIKSHPVKANCGHSHCYVCLRQWLETSWQCPYCRATMTEPPTADSDAARSIAISHPSWYDYSLVTMSWTGLRFPQLFTTPSP